MADMLVKLYNIPHSHDIEENLFKSGIRMALCVGGFVGLGFLFLGFYKTDLEIEREH